MISAFVVCMLYTKRDWTQHECVSAFDLAGNSPWQLLFSVLKIDAKTGSIGQRIRAAAMAMKVSFRIMGMG